VNGQGSREACPILSTKKTTKPKGSTGISRLHLVKKKVATHSRKDGSG